MIAFFVSTLSQNSRGWWYPTIQDVFNALGVPFNWVFSTIAGGPTATRRCALGLIECTPAQLAQIDAAANVWAFSAESLGTARVSDVSVASRNKLIQLGNNVFPGHGIVVTDTLVQSFDKLMTTMPADSTSIRSRAELIALWTQQFGPLPAGVLV